jgi:hypothetical protein
MKIKLKIILALTIYVFLTSYSSLHATDDNTTWFQSYKLNREHFKSLSPSEITYCEKLLKEILDDLDSKNQCNDDNDCILIDQEPFGDVVPYPKKLGEGMKKKMKEYCDRCDDGFSHSIKNEGLVDIPVCHNGKCKVKTSLKKKNSK